MSMTVLITVMAFTLTLGISCKKEKENVGCFDPELYAQMKDAFCPQDCPGVTGCDGKTYCNACIAATYGVRVE